MQYPKTISELLRLGQKRLDDLSAGVAEREQWLRQVRAQLEPALAGQVLTAAVDRGRLKLGVSSAAWASRIRYAAEAARPRIGSAIGVQIDTIRIRVARPPR